MATIDYFNPENIEKAGTNLDELTAIQKDFEKKTASYEQAAESVTGILLKAHSVHSGRYRVKDSTHLLKKIIRKRIENSQRIITIDNYEQELTDLAGVRALHLFKSDWKHIHKFITDSWALHEKPTAYYREGDSEQVLDMFTKQNCEVKPHPEGYRSVHYIVETSPTRAKRFVEIQVRTIFEEGWSEVDHQLRYPNFSNDPLIHNLLSQLNRLAGSADEMSSFVQQLNSHMVQSQFELEKLTHEKNEQIKKLEAIIAKATISAEDKSTLQDVATSINEGRFFTAAEIMRFLNENIWGVNNTAFNSGFDIATGTGGFFTHFLDRHKSSPNAPHTQKEAPDSDLAPDESPEQA
ncbi:RelA/SpoT domain-containing protein [Hymenobacter rubidus]|uniref:RelA/SpoT domain-containing protein n=1 Tax=Hymenobacter rubidus TaxID=1441626 RepID=UPI0019200689|nr:RelA/SpoT domain-containing protein [Hymenobacter rubidus]